MPDKITPLFIGGPGGLQHSRSPDLDTPEPGQIATSGDLLVASSSCHNDDPGCESSPHEDCGLLRVQWADRDETRSDALILEVAGDIDMATAPNLRKAVLEKLTTENAAPALLIIDLTEVTFMSSSGLSLLVEISRVCSRQRARLRLIVNSRVVLRPIEASGLTPVLNLFTDREGALSIR